MMRDATTDRFAPGARIGDYVVDREVAYEASGVVYSATHLVLPRQAHVKVTHPGARAASIQLLREACILEALCHPGVPRVHECGVLADRRPWSAIELMAGVALDRLGEAPLELHELVVALRDVSDILRHAHERGIVHRRLTASAIVRTQRRRCTYAIDDWGDARALDADADGTVDPRDDIHALGRIAFRALTGRAPEPRVSAAAHAAAAPAELVAIIDQMAAEPVARPTADEVYDRALWLCDALQVPPVLERPRWKPPQRHVTEEVSGGPEGDSAGFAVRIGRVRTR